LIAKLLRDGKQKIDLQTSAQESTVGLSRSLLIDDLDKNQLGNLKQIWRGPVAVLETSHGNYQAILIMDLERVRAERTNIQLALVERFDGDIGAISATQLHRFPGSINWKGEPFACKLIEIWDAIGPSNEGDFLVKTLTRDSPKQANRIFSNSEKTGVNMSAVAFGYTIQLLRKRVPDSQILAELGSPKWLRHHDKSDWPERTLHKAKLAFRPSHC
jgi:hypothetical protein